MGPLFGENYAILTSTIFSWSTCDRWTERRTGGS